MHLLIKLTTLEKITTKLQFKESVFFLFSFMGFVHVPTGLFQTSKLVRRYYHANAVGEILQQKLIQCKTDMYTDNMFGVPYGVA